jgi:hypothetical protein
METGELVASIGYVRRITTVLAHDGKHYALDRLERVRLIRQVRGGIRILAEVELVDRPGRPLTFIEPDRLEVGNAR